ncbi:MAG TPA: RNA polymerase sigma factor [Gemmatimonadales bacterium]
MNSASTVPGLTGGGAAGAAPVPAPGGGGKGGRTTEDDGTIVRRVLRGDVEAFGVLVRRYREAFGRYAVASCGDADLAADAMQEACIRAYDALATCRQPDRFGAWFFRILRNQCHNQRSRHRTHVPLEKVTAAAPGRADSRLEREDLRHRVERALNHLSPEQREAFVLRHVDGRGYSEMAALLGEREDRLRMRVHRARESVRRELEELDG